MTKLQSKLTDKQGNSSSVAQKLIYMPVKKIGEQRLVCVKLANKAKCTF